VEAAKSRLDRVSLRTFCLAIFCIALAVRLSAIFTLKLHYQWPVPVEWENIARNLALTGEFANPYPSPTGPTAHSAPAYPFLLSLMFRAAGVSPEGRLGCIVLNAVLASMAYALLPLLSAAAGLPVLVGTAAGVLGAIRPRVSSELVLVTGDTQLRALSWIAMHLVTLCWFRGNTASAVRWLAYGACWGAAFHVDPVLLPVCLFWSGVLVWRARRQAGFGRFGLVSRLLLLFIGVSVVLLPWTLRNRRQLGAWMFVRGNLGLELAVHNNDFATPMVPWEFSPVRRYEHQQLINHHPFGSERERSRIRAVGEAAYNRERLKEGLDWIRRNPKRFAVLSLERFAYFWFYPGVGKRLQDLVLHPMVIVAALGLLRMLKRHRLAGLLFLGDWLVYPLPYYFIVVCGRYRHPVEWTILLLSCYAVWEWWNARRLPVRPPGSVPHTRPDTQSKAA
jgi:hypothetical protein